MGELEPAAAKLLRATAVVALAAAVLWVTPSKDPPRLPPSTAGAHRLAGGGLVALVPDGRGLGGLSTTGPEPCAGLRNARRGGPSAGPGVAVTSPVCVPRSSPRAVGGLPRGTGAAGRRLSRPSPGPPRSRTVPCASRAGCCPCSAAARSRRSRTTRFGARDPRHLRPLGVLLRGARLRGPHRGQARGRRLGRQLRPRREGRRTWARSQRTRSRATLKRAGGGSRPSILSRIGSRGRKPGRVDDRDRRRVLAGRGPSRRSSRAPR